ncbi:MAG: NAD(P)-dependent dehydrogenase (short-subunit alcohol dehydrogenase family) [Halieaceae bacterium]|jgi:NAD(P)-dependent dehydrogenase (short-subunit alcohol dehydrogenase family)
MDSFSGKVAVVTGGASGVGRSLVKELLTAGAAVVIGDVEQTALDKVIGEFEGLGDVTGQQVDVSDPESVNALADAVYAQHGVCHLLFNNAGVAAPSANVWETTPNDWSWVHSVNVMGVVYGIQAFVPRMIASGEEGYVINTSSGDGGVSPLPYQSVYASSKAAVSCLTECLSAQLTTEGTALGASIFYPSGGMLATGIWTTDRNRPSHLAREKPGAPVPTVEEFKAAAEAAGMDLHFQDLDELARFCLQGILDKRFVIMIGIDDSAAILADRAERIGRCELPIDLATIPGM